MSVCYLIITYCKMFRVKIIVIIVRCLLVLRKIFSCIGGGLFVGGSVLRIVDNFILVPPDRLGV